MTYKLVTTADGIKNALQDLAGCPAVALDIETTSLSPRDGEIRLIQLSDGAGRNYIVDTFKLDNKETLKLFVPFFEAERPRKIIQNLKFEASWMQAKLGCDINGTFDTYIASRLIDDSCNSKLDEVLKKYLDIEISKEEQRSDWSVNELSESQMEYALTDVIHLPKLRSVLIKQLRDYNLIEVAEIEFNCTRVVSNMEYVGFPVDRTMYEALIERVTERRDEKYEELQSILAINDYEPNIQGGLFGDDKVVNPQTVNVNSWQQLIPAFAKIGINLPKTDKRTIATMVKEHPNLQYLTAYREQETLLKNFGQKNIKLINPQTGRLHPTFWQLVTSTGRFSSSNPNIQQQPRLPEFRECFRPTDANKVFLIYDYSGIELRILAQISQESVMIDAFNNDKDLHSITAKKAFNLPCSIDEVKKKYPEQRVLAKGLNFGIIYGMRGKKYADTTGISVAEANAAVKGFYEVYPQCDKYLHGIEKIGVAAKCVYSIAGRRMPLRFDSNNTFEVGEAERAARNYPIQSTSSDIIKVAMRSIYDNLKSYPDANIVNTVHDELIIECNKDDAEHLKEIVVKDMVNAAKRFLPDVKVEVEGGIAESWSEK